MSLWGRYATCDAQVLRAVIVGGKRGLPVVHLSGLRATRPQPMNGQDAGALLQRLAWNTPHTAKEAFVAGHHDIQTGDVLAVDGRTYTIRSAAEWSLLRDAGEPFTHLVLEEVKA
jgi:hypothetical protein